MSGRVLNAADGSDPQPLDAKPCGCSRPIPCWDEFETRCIRCGHVVEATPKPRRMKRSKPRTGEQLELDL